MKTTISHRLSVFLIIFISASISIFAQDATGIFFKVTKPGMKAPSYLLGSMHNISASFLPQITGYEKAYAEVTRVCIETDINKSGESLKENNERTRRFTSQLATAQLQANSLQQLKLPFDSTFVMVLGEEKLAQLDSMIKSVLPDAYKAVIPTVNNVHPVMLRALVDQIITAMALSGETNDGTSIDMHIFNQGAADGRHQTYLEPVALQDSLLVAMQINNVEKMIADSERPLPVQMNELYEEYKSLGKKVEVTSRFIEAYKSGDAQGVIDYFKASDTPAKLDVEKRNREWMKLLPIVLTEEPTLVTVGFAHLYPYRSAKGLIKDLQEAGFTLEKLF